MASDGTPSKQPSSFRHVTSLDGRTNGREDLKTMQGLYVLSVRTGHQRTKEKQTSFLSFWCCFESMLFADVCLNPSRTFLKGQWIRWEAADTTHAFHLPSMQGTSACILRHDHEDHWVGQQVSAKQRNWCHHDIRSVPWTPTAETMRLRKNTYHVWLKSARGWFLGMLTEMGIKWNSLVGVG